MAADHWALDDWSTEMVQWWLCLWGANPEEALYKLTITITNECENTMKCDSAVPAYLHDRQHLFFHCCVNNDSLLFVCDDGSLWHTKRDCWISCICCGNRWRHDCSAWWIPVQRFLFCFARTSRLWCRTAGILSSRTAWCLVPCRPWIQAHPSMLHLERLRFSAMPVGMLTVRGRTSTWSYLGVEVFLWLTIML